MKAIASLIFFSLLLFSCGKDTSSLSSKEGNNLHAKINGDDLLFPDIFTIGVSDEGPNYFTIQIIGTKIASGDTIHLSALFLSGSKIQFINGAVFDQMNSTLNRSFGGGFVNNSTTHDYAEMLSGKGTITAIDTIQKIISGTFQFKSKDDESGAIITITEGVFTDVKY